MKTLGTGQTAHLYSLQNVAGRDVHISIGCALNKLFLLFGVVVCLFVFSGVVIVVV